jgi:type IV pilus assembly protein PilV
MLARRPYPARRARVAHALSLRARQSGFTLIEVLVALLILAIGLLGLASLQLTSLKFNTDAYIRTQSTLLAYDIIDRMRLNRAAVAAGSYDVADGSSADAKVSAYTACAGSGCACDKGTACNAANLALNDLGRWYERLSKELPMAGDTAYRATVERNGTLVTVTLRWRERDIDKTQQWSVEFES